MSMIDEKRIGEFVLSIDLIKNNPEVAMDILRRVLVIKAEAEVRLDQVRYTAFGQEFSPLPNGVDTRLYFPLMHTDEDGRTSCIGFQ